MRIKSERGNTTAPKKKNDSTNAHAPGFFFIIRAMPRFAQDFTGNASFPRRALNALLDVFFPRRCLVTEKFPDDSGFLFLSEEGRERLRFIGEDCCPVCGAPRPDVAVAHGECVFCRDREFRFGRSRSLVVYDEAARRLILAIKYGAVHAAIADLAKIAAENEIFRRHLDGAVLVPVPLFPTRKAERGFNQSEVFARELCRAGAGTRTENLLARTRDTGTQTRLGADARRGNVREAFAAAPKFRKLISPKTRYVLVDDVFTTGSTLSECARALKKAGAKFVDAATFAHG